MSKSLVIGFGNIDRADDGIAYHIINALRRHLGQGALDEESTGLEDLNSKIDTVFLSQLTPELIDILTGYELIVFVDAHVDECLEPLHCEPVRLDSESTVFSHHITPAMLLVLLEALHHIEPVAYLVSLHGYDFDFHRELSPKVQSLIEPAVSKILELLK